jgi:hypothetical protein
MPYTYGSVIHVMTAWIARRQSRHYRHQRPCCRWPRGVSGPEPWSGFECDAATVEEHIARLLAISDTSAVQARKVGRLRGLPGNIG